VIRRLRRQDGFGLIELLVALIVLSAGLLAMLAVFTSGTVSLRRAGRIATANALADQQLELYRAITYSSIGLDSTSVNATDSTYRADSALGGSIGNDIVVTCTGVPNQCNPSRTATGPDSHSYRIDTYIVWKTPTAGGNAGRSVKLVTVVVRDSSNLSGRALARVASSFDQSTG
jgi:prepilin-type N-terminal cleavage/methylation domain-containing protein